MEDKTSHKMKQIIVIRADLKLPKGKLAVQAAHAAVDSVMKSDKRTVDQWLSEGQKKVILKVADEKELVRLFQTAKDKGFKASLITDAGLTVVAPGTKTCIGIGPDEEDRLNMMVGDLKLL